MSNRRKLRECGIQILYGLDFYDLQPESALATYATHFDGNSADDVFLEKIIEGVHGKKEDIDDLIRQFSTNWRLERMAIVDRNILRMATFELLHLPDVPRKVCINEAIEVAKKYGGDDSPSFINGILDRIALEIRGPETDEERTQPDGGESKPATDEAESKPVTDDAESKPATEEAAPAADDDSIVEAVAAPVDEGAETTEAGAEEGT